MEIIRWPPSPALWKTEPMQVQGGSFPQPSSPVELLVPVRHAGRTGTSGTSTRCSCTLPERAGGAEKAETMVTWSLLLWFPSDVFSIYFTHIIFSSDETKYNRYLQTWWSKVFTHYVYLIPWTFKIGRSPMFYLVWTWEILQLRSVYTAEYC